MTSIAGGLDSSTLRGASSFANKSKSGNSCPLVSLVSVIVRYPLLGSYVADD